ncbi:MAG: GntR family transcriptional regulator [Acidimicrobiales bacterium]
MTAARSSVGYDREQFRTRSEWLTENLRIRLRGGEWDPGQRLPGEHQLAADYGVSRATVRTALRHLESLGLTATRHGSGTFATVANREIRADLRRLDSLSETVADSGHEPGMRYRSKMVRRATPDEEARLDLSASAAVLATERALTADGTVVAFSYDAIPRELLGDGFVPDHVEGSLFRLLGDHGLVAASAITEIHAARGRGIGWGRRPVDPLYVLLDQVHYLPDNRPVMYSRTYFIEGRFQFSLVRTR